MEHEFEQEFRLLGLKVAYYRKAKNMTQEQLAEKLGTSTLGVFKLLIPFQYW